jgi:hypothetical protein
MKPMLQLYYTAPFDYFARVPWSENHKVRPTAEVAGPDEQSLATLQNPSAPENYHPPVAGPAPKP